MTPVDNQFLLFLLILLQPFEGLESSPGGCKLYGPSSPGIQCMRNDEAVQAVTNSQCVWMLELYASWCGHCQQFAPHFKDLGKELEAWSPVVRVGVFDCTESNSHQQMCGKFGVQAYPTIRFFQPLDPSPLSYKKSLVGGKKIVDLRHYLVDHILSILPRPQHWPDFSFVSGDEVVMLEKTDWTPTVFVFEGEKSLIGAELILDYVKMKSLRILRVFSNNTALVQHYSILDFPSVVIELLKNQYHVISGHSVRDPRSEFKKKIAEYTGSSLVTQPASVLEESLQMPAPPSDRNGHRHARTHHHSLLHHYNRVQLMDLLGAISYSLRSEVIIHSIISGPTFSALINYVTLLEQAFSSIKPTTIGHNLKEVRIKLDSRRSSKFIAQRDFRRILDSKLDEELFPKQPKWKACNGSQPHLRGYPCALWMLMHTLTVLTLPIQGHTPPSLTITSKHALTILIGYIKNFFSCEVCRSHFLSMAHNHTPSLSTNGDAILWLWQTHNLVNARLKLEQTGDPNYPKDLFPYYTKCPYCYRRSSDGGSLPMSHDRHPFADVHPSFNNTDMRYWVESEVFNRQQHGIDRDLEDQLSLRMGRSLKATGHEYTFSWNHTAVLLYLWNFYHLDYHRLRTHPTTLKGHHQSHQGLHAFILIAAWPNKYEREKKKDVGSEDYHHRLIGHRRVSFGSNSCLLYVVLVTICLMFGFYWLFKKKRWIKLWRSRRFRFLDAHEKV